MTSLLIKNIAQLLQVNRNSPSPDPFLMGQAMSVLPSLKDAWLLIKGDSISDFGSMQNCPNLEVDEIIDAQGRFVLPSFIDSHTHTLFAKPRSEEFVDRIKGLTYAEIAAKGGGILNSAKHLAERDEDVLIKETLLRIRQLVQTGTGYIEIKSGYGLSREGELKMLRIIKKLKALSPIPIKATFLAAHAIPTEYRENKAAFLKLMLEEVLPIVAEEELADYIDIFCEKGFFDVSDTHQLLKAGEKYGLKGKIHTNQFTCSGGIQAAIDHGAISVDHLEIINDEEIAQLKAASTIPTLLPSAPFFLNDEHFPPMRKIIDQGLGIVLATDFNPGSTPSGSMPFVLSLACIKGRITPAEAINAATYNAAFAVEAADAYGSIDQAKKANLIITTPMQDFSEIPYFFTQNPVWKSIINGKVMEF